MTSPAYDAIVVGLGAMGSSAVWNLARRGQKVLGIERFGIPHAMGSSHGVNRIIRLAYYEDPSYVPLLQRAFELWRETETAFGEQLLHVTGSIDCADQDHYVFTESLRSCELHGLEHEVLDSGAIMSRWPAFDLPLNHRAVFQPAGGFVMSERAIVAHINLALDAGAEIHGFEHVLSWQTTSSGVEVTTNRRTYEASQLLFSAGAWTGTLVPGMSSLLRPERQVLGWFQPSNPVVYRPDALPVFNLAGESERWYGFPIWHIPGFKFGKYHHRDEKIDPEKWTRDPDQIDEETLRVGIRQFFPTADGPVLSMHSCIFTNTPDEHFIIDRLTPDSPVVVASPCSGHGYKFASVIGEVLADLIIADETRHNIDLFRLDRFSA